MARLDVNRSGEMAVFVRVVELGGFSAAARVYRMTPSAVSKLIGRLEARLGARLINRSTRGFHLTPEGVSFYDRSICLLADLDEAEREAGSSAIARGRVRVSANVPFGTHFLLPLVPGLLAAYPQITLDISLTDEVIDLFEERTDVAVRAGPLKSSRLVARKLGETPMVIVGSPAYLERHGMPRSVGDLERHNRLGFSYARALEGWPLLDGRVKVVVPLNGNVRISDGESLRQVVLTGLGLARLAAFQVKTDIAAGRLMPVLESANPGDREQIHAVFLGRSGPLPARVRAFLDYVSDNVRIR